LSVVGCRQQQSDGKGRDNFPALFSLGQSNVHVRWSLVVGLDEVGGGAGTFARHSLPSKPLPVTAFRFAHSAASLAPFSHRKVVPEALSQLTLLASSAYFHITS